MLTSASPAPAAATLPLFLPQAPPDKILGLFHAATLLAQLLGHGRALDSRALRSAMETAFYATDAEGVWVWKDAYDALEAAQVMFLRKFGAAMRTRAGSTAAMLEMLTRLAGRLPSQTRRSEESEHLQQFSTPIALGFVAAEAAALTPADLVLEPSAGTGLLAIFAELARARLILNEIADTRAGLLERLFRGIAVTRHNAEQIHDRLDPAIRASVVLMNPPFSASPHIEGRFAEAAIRHVSSALARHTVAELDVSSAEARVVSAPADRTVRRASRRLDLRRLGFFGLALLIGLGAAWYGHQWWTVGRFIESTDDAYVGGDVTVIAPKVAGFIIEVAVTDNQAMHAGDLLVKLDDRDYRAALAKAAAAVAAEEATLANLDATRRLQESMIAQAEAEVAAAEAEVARSRFDVLRYSQLASDQYASLQRFQQADADNKKAIAAVEKMRAALAAARRRLDVIDTQKQQTRAVLDQAIAERDLAQLNLGYTELRAPIDGVIGNRSARTGAYAMVAPS